MFIDVGLELPFATRLLVSISDFLRANGLYVFLAFVLAIYILLRFLKTPHGLEIGLIISNLKFPLLKASILR